VFVALLLLTVELPRLPVTTGDDLVRGRKIPFTIPISNRMLSLLKTVKEQGDRSDWLRRLIAEALVREAKQQGVKDYILEVD